jgi:hypothetical protein
MSIMIDPATVSPSKAIMAAARAAPLLVLTGRALRDLADELGGHEAAALFLHRLVERTGAPLGVNLPTGADGSRTEFWAPTGWPPERLRGWVDDHREALEAQFGPATIREAAS